jgi:hypothetical protein
MMSNFKMETDFEFDVEYLTGKRNLALSHFIKGVKSNIDIDYIENRYKTLIRIQKQLILLQDALIIHKISKKWEKN